MKPAREARCVTCGELFTADTLTGPLPRICEPCDPAAAARRREHRALNLGNARRRSLELTALRDRNEALKAELAAATRVGASIRRDHRVPADRRTVALAVREVGQAVGARDTARKLRWLAAEAQAWADALNAHETDVPQEIAA